MISEIHSIFRERKKETNRYKRIRFTTILVWNGIKSMFKNIFWKEIWFLFKMSFTVRSINLHFKFNQFQFNRLKNSKFRYSPLVRAIEMIQPMSAVCVLMDSLHLNLIMSVIIYLSKKCLKCFRNEMGFLLPGIKMNFLFPFSHFFYTCDQFKMPIKSSKFMKICS